MRPITITATSGKSYARLRIGMRLPLYIRLPNSRGICGSLELLAFFDEVPSKQEIGGAASSNPARPRDRQGRSSPDGRFVPAATLKQTSKADILLRAYANMAEWKFQVGMLASRTLHVVVSRRARRWHSTPVLPICWTDSRPARSPTASFPALEAAN